MAAHSTVATKESDWNCKNCGENGSCGWQNVTVKHNNNILGFMDWVHIYNKKNTRMGTDPIIFIECKCYNKIQGQLSLFN